MGPVNLLHSIPNGGYINLSTFIFAYLDPGSGSFILQLIIAGLAGLMFVLKGYWSRILALFKKPPPHSEIKSPDTNENDQ